MTVAEYRKESGVSDKGTLTAPLDGSMDGTSSTPPKGRFGSSCG